MQDIQQNGITVDRSRGGQMEIRKAVEDYLTFARKVKGFSPTTITTYRSNLEQFFQTAHIKTLDELTLDKVDAFFVQIEAEGLKRNTLARYSSSIRSFIFYQNRNGWTQVLSEHVVQTKREQVVIRYVTPEEVNKLLEVIPRSRDRLIVLLLFTSGMRINELINITVEDITENTIHIIRKGGKHDDVVIDQGVADYLQLYLMMEQITTGYIFRSTTGQRIHSGAVSLCLKLASRKAGIKHVNPHSLRHGFGTYLAESGANIYDIMKMMGHVNVNVAMRYLHMSKSHKVQQHAIYAPKTINPLTNDTTSAKIPSEFWNEP